MRPGAPALMQGCLFQRYLRPEGRLIGIVGDAGGKSLLAGACFPACLDQ